MAKTTDTTAEDKIVAEVKKRFERCQDFESDARVLWKSDLRFANGDPENGWQWEDAMRKSREIDKRPCLTINKVKQHNRQITNDARQNKPSIRVYPVDSGADKKTAEILNGVIRHIEANSNADVAYDTASEFAVDAGLGYWRVVTDYASDDSFDQEIFIKRVKNPLNVYLDPDIQEADGSDARYGLVFEDIPKEEFKARYPNADAVTWPLEGGDDWLRKDNIRICEYFKRVETNDTLWADEQGDTLKQSEMKPEMVEAAKAAGLRSRVVKRCQVKWYLVAGNVQLEEKEWPGKYIPIVRVVGDEVEVDGKVDRKGHTRQMKDAQRMYNYNSSASVEYGALQTKTPILAPAEAIEGYESYWDNANTSNLPYLPYNHLDEQQNPIPMPIRMTPPAPATLFLEGMRTASEEMKMASGQYDASMGAKSNETSGRAIMARQREGDTATFHFIDNVARAIKYTGKILLDLIPKIYDTPRIVRILGEDGSEDEAHFDPSQQAAYTKTQNLQGEIQEIYNPSVGRYDVVVAVGPSYSTRRQEAFQALTEMASRNPQLMQFAGDIVMKAADFPMADELAKRLAKSIPPEIVKDDEDGPSPGEQQAQQKIQELEGQLQALGQEYNALDTDKTLDQEKIAVEKQRLENERLKTELELQRLMNPEAPAVPTDTGMNEADKLEREHNLKLEMQARDHAHQKDMEAMRLRAAKQPGPLMEQDDDFNERPQDDAMQILQAVAQGVGALTQGMATLAQGINELKQISMAPKELVRDEQGRPIGSRLVLNQG